MINPDKQVKNNKIIMYTQRAQTNRWSQKHNLLITGLN